MLEHHQLWLTSPRPDGSILIRSAPEGPLLGQADWLPGSWFTPAMLEVREYDDAPLLLRIRRAWTLRRRYHLHDADDLHVGSVQSDALLSPYGGPVAWRLASGDGAVYHLIDGPLLATERRDRAGRRMNFGAGEETGNPFLRMLVLAAVLTL